MNEWQWQQLGESTNAQELHASQESHMEGRDSVYMDQKDKIVPCDQPTVNRVGAMVKNSQLPSLAPSEIS